MDTRLETPLIRLEQITKDYEMPGGASGTVLKQIDLTIREGEFLCLLGPSGSGKSTLLRILAGLIAPTFGRVLYRGAPIQGVNPGVAMVFQTFALFPWLTVLENVEVGLRAKGIPAAAAREKALSAIDLVGLDGFEGAYPKELSGGMRQRVGFARAVVVEPDVLLMDEPFSALDVLTAENLRRDLLELWIERKIPTKAVIIVTHSIEEAVYLADRAVVLSRDPARVILDLPIALPHWRERKDPRFLRLVDQIYSTLTRHPERKEAQRRFQPVPAARSGALTGLVELLDDRDLPIDLYRLGDMLTLDLEDLLPIVEAAELLTLATVAEGDIGLTERGREFALASVLERKEIFRDLALERVPFLMRIRSVLEQKGNRKMSEEFFLDLLERHVGREEARHQLDTLIDWGRYGELFAYDHESGQLFLETGEPAPETP